MKIGVWYRRRNDHLEAWAFLNHISLLQCYSLYQRIIAAGLTDSYSAEDVIDICRNICKVVLDDGPQIISEVAKPDKRTAE